MAPLTGLGTSLQPKRVGGGGWWVVGGEWWVVSEWFFHCNFSPTQEGGGWWVILKQAYPHVSGNGPC